ncbi:MAG: hypothetical protein ACIAQZ_05020 [Sedimentisphaeraceae bacterium JB056]
MDNDGSKDLELLSIFHYILGGFIALCSFFPLIHLFIGLMLLRGDFAEAEGDMPPAFIGWFFVAMAVLLITSGLLLALCIIITGSKLKKRRSWLFCIIIAAIECSIIPFGIIVGVFTIVVLNRDYVKASFYSRSDPSLNGEDLQGG